MTPATVGLVPSTSIKAQCSWEVKCFTVGLFGIANEEIDYLGHSSQEKNLGMELLSLDSQWIFLSVVAGPRLTKRMNTNVSLWTFFAISSGSNFKTSISTSIDLTPCMSLFPSL